MPFFFCAVLIWFCCCCCWCSITIAEIGCWGALGRKYMSMSVRGWIAVDGTIFGHCFCSWERPRLCTKYRFVCNKQTKMKKDKSLVYNILSVSVVALGERRNKYLYKLIKLDIFSFAIYIFAFIRFKAFSCSVFKSESSKTWNRTFIFFL